ncbi:MAG: SGNH/GDSL hydrolase family protein [Nitrospiraceae bacterium]
MEAPVVPRIVCFGDSLTSGYQSPTMAFPQVLETPYGQFLQDRLKEKAYVTVSGLCGETTAEMVQRFGRDVVERRPTYVIILGGTNDLGGWRAPREIMRHLLAMYEQAQKAGITPVGVTVPSIRLGTFPEGRPMSPDLKEARRLLDDHLDRRRILNRMIQDSCARAALPCVDLFAATAEPDSWQLAEAYSNDGLHLTTEGYQRFAELLYAEVFAPALGDA